MAQSRGLYLRVGALVVAGLVLAAGFILFFTANRIGGSNKIYETYLRESVQGLEVGASVRFRGVAIGRVTEIGLVAAEYRAPRVESERAPFQLVYVRFAVDERRTGETDSVDDAIRLGLRVRLASQGITGVSYLELDFVDPTRFPKLEVPWEPRFVFIPSIPSNLAQVQSAAEAILQQLKDADIKQLLTNVSGLITSLRGKVDTVDVAQLQREAEGLIEDLRKTLTQTDLPGTVAAFRRSAGDASGTLEEFRRTASDARGLINSREIRQALAAVSAAATELRATAAKLPGSVANIDAGVRTARTTVTDVQADIGPILRDLRAAVGNLRDLTEQLRRSPSQTIFGAPPPAPAETRR